MNDKTSRVIRTIYGFVLSLLLIVAGLCLMVACVDIYSSGDKPFSPAAVAAAFSQIAVPVHAAIVMTLGAFLLNFFLPSESKKPGKANQTGAALRRLSAKADLGKAEPNLMAAVLRERMDRKTHGIIATILLVLCSIIFFNYATTPGNFHQSDITGSMVEAMYRFIPCLLIPFGYYVFAAYYGRASMERELKLIREVIKSGAVKAPEEDAAPSKVNWLLIGRYSFLLIAIGLVIFGYFTGGTLDVLTKAINICTECVGLG